MRYQSGYAISGCAKRNARDYYLKLTEEKNLRRYRPKHLDVDEAVEMIMNIIEERRKKDEL